jgi:hypothetical protein
VRFLYVPVAALALIGASASSSAGGSAPTAIDAGADETETTFSQYYDLLYDRQFDKALTLTTQLHPDPDNKAGTAIVDGMRAAALIGLKRDSEANRLISDAERLAPQEPFPTTVVFEGSLIADRFQFAADALDRLIARFPDVAREQRFALVSYFLRNEPTDQEPRNEDRRVALARIGFGGSASGDWIAAGAVDILVRRGDLAGAGDLLTYIDDPQTIENLLVQKRYAALWPKVEDRAGIHLTKVRESSVASAEQDYLKAPDDHEKLKVYITALRLAGRRDDVIALRSKLPITRETIERVDEDYGWSINELALALYEDGRAAEADQTFALLNETPMENASWRVSMIINRLELLVTGGKFEKAATLLGATELSAKVDGSDYARQLVRRLKFCTLSSLGRKAEATTVLPDMLAHAKDAPQPTVEGLLCAGEIDQAEQLTLQTLNDPKATSAKKRTFEADFVRALQPVPLTSDDPSVWANKLTVLRQRPAIAAFYSRLGRDMPAEYLAAKTK